MPALEQAPRVVVQLFGDLAADRMHRLPAAGAIRALGGIHHVFGRKIVRKRPAAMALATPVGDLFLFDLLLKLVDSGLQLFEQEQLRRVDLLATPAEQTCA